MRVFSGQRAFLVQRLTALVLLACVAAAALRLALGPAPSLEAWQAWVAQPFGAAALFALCLALVFHAWVGVRDVVLDYVHPLPARLLVLSLVAAALVLIAAWTAFILVSHAL